MIGLGRFGRALAGTLTRLGNEVLGVDASPKVVQACAVDMTHVVQADATDVEALRQIGAADFGRAAVAIGTDIEASILATYALVDLGVPRIWAKAVTVEHGAILERVGAHRVVFPELEMGERVAHTMVGRTIDYVELDEDFVLIETTAPRELVGPDARGRRPAQALRGHGGGREDARRRRSPTRRPETDRARGRPHGGGRPAREGRGVRRPALRV